MKLDRSIPMQLARVAAVPLLFSACIATDSPILEAGGGCEELTSGDFDNANVDPAVRRFMRASATFRDTASELKESVLSACADIALDLGAEDTWSASGDLDDAVSNGAGTGACDAASRLIEGAILDGRSAGAEITLLVSEGACRYDFEAQARCDAECAANVTCDPGSVETRCEPGSLSVVCDAECEAGASCEGHVENPCNCMGECRSTCEGECRGTCTHPDGSTTENDPSCMGRCSASCVGRCHGTCTVEEPVDCGANVRCRGGCTSTYTEPVCESRFTPPSCSVDASCHASCSAEVSAHPVCEPPVIQIYADVTLAPQLEPVARTLEENLPMLIESAEQRGEVLMQAIRDLSASGEDLGARLEDLGGHSLACVAASTTSLAESLGRFDVTLQASARVTASVETSAP